MVRGLYTAWTGLRNEEKRMDVVTNNMANADTTGYKKVDVTSQSFDRQLAVKIDDPTIGPGTNTNDMFTDCMFGDEKIDNKYNQDFNYVKSRLS